MNTRRPLDNTESKLRGVSKMDTVPSVETPEEYARALEIPLYQQKAEYSSSQQREGCERKDEQGLRQFVKAFSRMNARNRKLFLVLAQRFTNRSAKA